MKLFVLKSSIKYWRHVAYIEGYANGTVDTRNQAEKAGVYTWSTKGPHWHNMKRN